MLQTCKQACVSNTNFPFFNFTKETILELFSPGILLEATLLKKQEIWLFRVNNGFFIEQSLVLFILFFLLTRFSYERVRSG